MWNLISFTKRTAYTSVKCTSERVCFQIVAAVLLTSNKEACLNSVGLFVRLIKCNRMQF